MYHRKHADTFVVIYTNAVVWNKSYLQILKYNVEVLASMHLTVNKIHRLEKRALKKNEISSTRRLLAD